MRIIDPFHRLRKGTKAPRSLNRGYASLQQRRPWRRNLIVQYRAVCQLNTSDKLVQHASVGYSLSVSLWDAACQSVLTFLNGQTKDCLWVTMLQKLDGLHRRSVSCANWSFLYLCTFCVYLQTYFTNKKRFLTLWHAMAWIEPDFRFILYWSRDSCVVLKYQFHSSLQYANNRVVPGLANRSRYFLSSKHRQRCRPSATTGRTASCITYSAW